MGPRRFLFVMWDGGGNVPPQLGLARKLVAAGHQVRVLTEPSLRPDVEATGAAFGSFTSAPHRQDRAPESDLVRDFDARTPIGALAAIRDRVMLGPARAYAQDTLAEIQRFQPHVLAVDWVLTGAVVAGEAAGVPTAVLLHGNNLLPEPGKPAPGFGFLPARSALGRARDSALTWVFLRLLDKGLPALNDARLAFGLGPLRHALDQLERPARLLCLYPEAFDLPADRHPAALRYVGPVLEQPAWAEPWSPPWPPDDRRPLVVVSMSTTYMRQERVLRRCIQALSSMPVRALVTVGPTLDPSAFHGGQNVRIVGSAAHDQVLAHAAAVVTHAGMGTVMRALAHGLPLVCMPQGRDQHDVAARVRWHGAGLRLGPGASAARIRAALDRVLWQPSFREAAGRLRQAIQADLAADRAVTELQAMADTTPPLQRAPEAVQRSDAPQRPLTHVASIAITDYNPTWPEQFEQVALALGQRLGDAAISIDHIGSTSVPGLAAKDVIDVQVTVASLADADRLAPGFQQAGYVATRYRLDHRPARDASALGRWEKRLWQSPPGARPVNVHVRVAGWPNQRYALLFRDYLRSHPHAAAAYERLKRALAQRFGNDLATYTELKDHACDLIMAAAEEWAAASRVGRGRDPSR